MKIAVFGFGSIGKRHCANLIELGGHEIVVVDPAHDNPNFHTLNWDWKPEAVLVCTPPKEHNVPIGQAIDHGCNIFTEKPLTGTGYGDAAALAWLARKANVHLAVAYQLRFALQAFRQEAAGSNVQWVCSSDMRRWPSRYEKVALDEYSHEIDAACWLNGPVQTVVAKQYGPVWNLSLQHQQYFSRITIHPLSEVTVRYAQSDRGVSWTFNQAANDQAYKDELQEFLAVCAGKERSTMLCTGVEAAHVVRIIEAARRSAENCEVVHLA